MYVGGKKAAEYEFVLMPTWVTFAPGKAPDNPDIREGMMKYEDEEGHAHVMDLNYFDWGINRDGRCVYNGGILFRDDEWTSHT